MDTKQHIIEGAKKKADSVPVIFDLKDDGDKKKLSILFERNDIHGVVDDYREQEHELFAIQHPHLVFTPTFEDAYATWVHKLDAETTEMNRGKWVYFPWIGTLVHILEDAAFQKVRMARNRNLITEAEQEKFYHARIGIAGLSVGNSVTLAIVLQGGGRHIKIADLDRLVLSNTNRIRAGISDLGLKKTEMTARQIYLLNPYAQVELFSDGLNRENIEAFFEELDIVVDEIDNLAVKYLIREQAQKRKLPVVMAADNGDNGVVDIERYDFDPRPEFFHGRMGKVTYEELAKLDKRGIGKMITKHVGLENVTPQMQYSLTEMGKTIVSWPQLGGAALLNGSSVAYCVRRIVNGQPLENNRALISLDEKLIPDYAGPEAVAQRQVISEAFRRQFGL